MRISAWLVPLGMAAAVASAPAQNEGQKANAAEPAMHSHERCELHGGTVTMTKNHHFETLFSPDGVRVFVYSEQQTPMMAEKAKGTVTLTYKDGRKLDFTLLATKPAKGETTAFFCPMHTDVVQMKPGNCPKCGMMLEPQDYFFAATDLSKAAPGALKAMVKLTGMGTPEPEVSFTETFQGWAKTAAKEESDAPHAPSSGEQKHGN